MQIILAEYGGFCFGVKRAIQLAEKTSQEGMGPVFTFGPLIHNPQAVAKLEEKGIKVINRIDEAEHGCLIVRSHGVGPDTAAELITKFKVIDATCPFVAKAQRLVRKFHEDGYQVIILGNEGHPEVIALQEWSNNKAVVIENLDDLNNVILEHRVALVAQTTQNEELFQRVASVLRSRADEVIISNTICPATKERQEAAGNLAPNVDIMIIIGGLKSSNTRKLAEICRDSGTPTYHIENSQDINVSWFEKAEIVGVAAGASTPDWIIEEVIQKMTELNQKEQQEMQENMVQQNAVSVSAAGLEMANSAKDVNKGDIVEGKVIKITENEIFIDFGGKSEGVIPLSELSVRHPVEPQELVKVDDILKVMVIQEENNEGQPVFSKKKADRILAWDSLEELMDSKQELNATVVEVVKGGVLVDVGVKGFVPASLLERGYVENLNEYLGKALRLRVIEIDKEKQRVVLSQKAILDEEYEQKKQELWQILNIGDVKKGIVRRITNFGAFVDIGGLEGLLHVSELAWGRVNHPNDVLQEEQEVEVKIIGLDKEKQKISLSLKELQPDPWLVQIEKYKIDEIVDGKVLRTAPFGAFVELEPGVEGLVHISQLANQHVAKTEDVVKGGDEVKVKVLKIDKDAKKISLSVKQAEEADQRNQGNDAGKSYQTSDNNLTLGDIFGDLFSKNQDE